MGAWFRTDDPGADADRYFDKDDVDLEGLPVCKYCKAPIEDEHYYDFGDWCACEFCLDEHHRKLTELYRG